MLDRWFSALEQRQLFQAIGDTFILLSITGALVLVLGILLGYALYLTDQKEVATTNKYLLALHRILGLVIDGFRSIPFVVLIILLIPFTIIVVGTILGPMAALPALIISATPFYARIVYNAFREMPKGNYEALQSMGVNPIKIFLINIKEALPALISGFTVTLVTLVGFIAMAGVIGTGGLGNLAVRQFEINPLNPPLLMYVSVLLLLLVVFIIQITGDFIAKKIDKR